MFVPVAHCRLCYCKHSLLAAVDNKGLVWFYAHAQLELRQLVLETVIQSELAVLFLAQDLLRMRRLAAAQLHTRLYAQAKLIN